jgi:hypothetical protein
MAYLLIPVRHDIYAYRMTIILDGADYDILFRMNDRDGFWYTSIYNTVTGDAILEGVRLVNGTDLLAQYRAMNGLPAGKFHVGETSGLLIEPDENNIGDEVKLIYEEAS